MTLPADVSPRSTWPLKNRIITTEIVKKTASEVRPNLHTTHSVHSPPSAKTNNLLDEVDLEEKRLINALKNGDVLNEEPPASSSQTTATPTKHRENADAASTTSMATKWGLRNARRVEQQVPHPELTSTQRQHLRHTAANPVRPFLTRGSVAERVLIFERCPSDLLLDKRARAPITQIPKPQV